MSKTLSIREVRADLAHIVSQVESGERVVLTRRGKPVAQILPISKPQKPFPDHSALRASIKVKGPSLSQIVSQLRDEARY